MLLFSFIIKRLLKLFRPFIEARCAIYNIDLFHEIGFQRDSQSEYKCRPCIHMDCIK